MIDKTIAAAEYHKIEPVVILNKTDLEDGDAIEAIYRQAGFVCIQASARTGEGIETIREQLRGRVSVFTGNSGVGKSSLLNCIDERLGLSTGEISQKLGRGRHTTRHVEIYELENGGLVADTPGFSTLEYRTVPTNPQRGAAGLFPGICSIFGTVPVYLLRAYRRKGLCHFAGGGRGKNRPFPVGKLCGHVSGSKGHQRMELERKQCVILGQRPSDRTPFYGKRCGKAGT